MQLGQQERILFLYVHQCLLQNTISCVCTVITKTSLTSHNPFWLIEILQQSHICRKWDVKITASLWRTRTCSIYCRLTLASHAHSYLIYGLIACARTWPPSPPGPHACTAHAMSSLRKGLFLTRGGHIAMPPPSFYGDAPEKGGTRSDWRTQETRNWAEAVNGQLKCVRQPSAVVNYHTQDWKQFTESVT